VKKSLIIASALIVVLCACNRKNFVKKITGTWTLDKYTLADKDLSASYDTSHANYKLTINGDQSYTESWIAYTYIADSTITVDTIGYDSVSMTYTILRDTNRFVTTLTAPHAGGGRWDLLNSEEDLQLRSDSDVNNPAEYRILELKAKNLNLLKGNEEFDFTK
ncbi:MAG TPA: DUF5004 domain-containing protein, partial [Chitinophagales bacterium]|nr:DUF5004 domain-containing protein [Chitinophagales bacterium]